MKLFSRKKEETFDKNIIILIEKQKFIDVNDNFYYFSGELVAEIKEKIEGMTKQAIEDTLMMNLRLALIETDLKQDFDIIKKNVIYSINKQLQNLPFLKNKLEISDFSGKFSVNKF